MIESEIMEEVIKVVKLIKKCLKEMQDQQHKYYDPWHKMVEFKKGNHFFLKLSLMNGITRFEKANKL